MTNLVPTDFSKLYADYLASNCSFELAFNYLKKAREKSDIVYNKPLLEIYENTPRDLFAHVCLHHHGKSFTVLEEKKIEGFKFPDLQIDKDIVEIKSPDGNNKRAIERAFQSARDQFKLAYPKPVKFKTVLFNAKYYNFDKIKTFKDIKWRMSRYRIDVCLYLDKDGTFEEIKKNDGS